MSCMLIAFKICHIASQLQYQHPPACPAYHIPRLELLQQISSAILNSDITPTIGTTVTIRGIGGIGKSTIAKALCHDPLIKKHFVNGFLWISLTPPLSSLATMLSKIYQTLTDKSATPNASVLMDKIKSLVSNPLCKLLVILDDVWEAKDAMMFVDVFGSCKTILTTRKMNINVEIPPVACFDIKQMTTNESVKLLTLQIVEVKLLHATDINRIEELARDLHYWPLLLNLVHGQLYFHCIEWNESPQDAILKVHQELLDNGLTAFDPKNQLEASRDKAVRASITASLKLLAKNEEIVLFSIASSLYGLGIYTFKDVLPYILQMDFKQFDKYTRNLWCHGLINFEDLTFPSVNTKIPCIGIHEVIAHYINENMPDEYYSSVGELKVIVELCYEYMKPAIVNDYGQYFLSQADAFVIPLYIRFLMVRAKKHQIEFFAILNVLIEQNILLLQNDIFMRNCYNIQFPSLKHMHRIIKEDCKTIHSLLADNKYNEAITWAKQYFVNHPCILTLEAIVNNLNVLFGSCESHKLIIHFKQQLKTFKDLQRNTKRLIVGYSHVYYLVNAVAPGDDVKHYLKCSTLYEVRHQKPHRLCT